MKQYATVLKSIAGTSIVAGKALMPLYEYGCGACGKVSEISHRMSDPPAVDCPVCGKPQLSKLVSAAGFRLKGAGWYETDFKSDGKKNLAGDTGGASGGDSKPAGDSGGKSDSGGDAKPAAAAAASCGTGACGACS
ncbi:MAG TPA: zinc ribbon domain-containing protein [Nevskiaceae bacterium]|nr:zinc ribbon domain-containing protein [Nevskiaceae bacterium]